MNPLLLFMSVAALLLVLFAAWLLNRFFNFADHADNMNDEGDL